jgi:hypothetical protein
VRHEDVCCRGELGEVEVEGGGVGEEEDGVRSRGNGVDGGGGEGGGGDKKGGEKFVEVNLVIIVDVNELKKGGGVRLNYI